MPNGLFRDKGKRVWRCKVRYPDGTVRARSTGMREPGAALIAYRRLQREAADPAMHPGARPPVPISQVITLYVRSRTVAGGRSRRGCAVATLRCYEQKGEQLRRGLGEKFDVGKLRLRDLEAYIARRRSGARPVTDHTIAKELGVLRAALRRAKRDGAWHGDLGEVMPEFSPGYTPRRRYLERTEYDRLLAVLSTERARLVAFLVMTGARNAEWQAVEMGHVDLARAQLTLPGTKTRGSLRAVPIPPPLLPVLEVLKTPRTDHPGDHLFRPWSNIRRDLARACVRAAIPRVTPNDLRRTYATWLRLGGVAIDRIAKLLGHSDSRMVERVYGQLGPQSLAADVAGVFGGAR